VNNLYTIVINHVIYLSNQIKLKVYITPFSAFGVEKASSS